MIKKFKNENRYWVDQGPYVEYNRSSGLEVQMIKLNQILIRSNSVKIKHYNRYCCYTLLWCVILL